MMWTRIALALLMPLAFAAPSAVGARPGAATIPDNLAVPAGNVLLFKARATGAQIYTCTPRADAPDTFSWVFTAPDATLWNDTGEQLGTHSAGPTWAGNDGSAVMGEVVERATAPDTDAIPWLLLKTRPTSGAGAFSTITYIQRLETAGGIAPPDVCDHTAVGAERAIPYTATYAFYFRAAQ